MTQEPTKLVFKRWSEEEKKFMRENARKLRPSEIGTKLGRTARAVKWQMSQGKIKGYRTWSPREDAILQGALSGAHVKDLAALTGRSWTSVWQRCVKLGIDFKRKARWSEAEVEQLRAEAEKYAPQTLAARIGRPLRSVQFKAARMGLKLRRVERGEASQPVARVKTPKRVATQVKREASRLAWCGVCSAPVVNTAEGWRGHYERVGCNQPKVVRRFA